MKGGKKMKKIFENKFFIILSLFLIFGAVTVIATTIGDSGYSGIQVDNYFSGSGKQGITQSISFNDSDENLHLIEVEDGLIVNYSLIEPQESEFPLEGLISYYKFDETSGVVVDELGTNNATATGITRGITGNINNAFLYEDDPDIVYIENPEGLAETNLSGIMWLNITSWVSEGQDEFFFFDGLNDESIGIDTLPGYILNFRVWDTDASGLGSCNYSDYMNKWTFLYWEVTPTTLKLYLDNETKIDEAANFSLLSSGIVNLTVGNIFFGGRSIIGKIDEVGIWNRTLSEEEIQALYNDGNGLTFSN
jgi:hypothetical protein